MMLEESYLPTFKFILIHFNNNAMYTVLLQVSLLKIQIKIVLLKLTPLSY